MYRKHNLGKNLQHTYMHTCICKIYFGNTSDVKDLVTTLRNEVCKHKETKSRIISDNFY
jgi:hypothetical protein